MSNGSSFVQSMPASMLFNDLVDQGGIEEDCECPDQDGEGRLRLAEKQMEKEEYHFDSAYSSHLLIDDTDT